MSPDDAREFIASVVDRCFDLASHYGTHPDVWLKITTDQLRFYLMQTSRAIERKNGESA